ncbi:MAG: pentapeptide repeat-containing protein [Pseudomonadota bacterium]|nr:pentapeptide repeat-containing protein [Pseudomonadota bacterium]
MSDVNTLVELDVSDCGNLTEINSGVVSLSPRASSGDTTLERCKLQVLRTTNCTKLKSIVIDDAKQLRMLIANNCDLTTVKLSAGALLYRLLIIEVENNRNLKTLVANPTRLSRFSAVNCHMLENALNNVICRRLLEQLVNPRDSASKANIVGVFRLLIRVKPDAIAWAIYEHNAYIFNFLSIPGVDATNMNFSGGDFYQSDFSNTKLWGVNLSNCNFNGSNFTGVDLGQLSRFIDHKSAIIALTQQGDGKLFASADSAGSVILRNKDMKLYEWDHSDVITALSISPNGKLLAIASGLQIICYDIDPMSKLPYQKLPCETKHEDVVRALAFTEDSSMLVSTGDDGQIIKTICTTGMVIRSVNAKCGPILSLTMHNNTITFAAGCKNGVILVWNVNTLYPIKQIDAAHNGAVNCLQFIQGGRFLISAGEDKCLKIWSFSKWLVVNTLNGHENAVRSFKLNKKNDLLFSVGPANEKGETALIVWDLKFNRMLKRISYVLPIVSFEVVSQPSSSPSLTICVAGDDNQILRYPFAENTLRSSVEHIDCTGQLNANGTDITATQGFTTEDVLLLKQIGAEGEPAVVMAKPSPGLAEESTSEDYDEEEEDYDECVKNRLN